MKEKFSVTSVSLQLFRSLLQAVASGKCENEDISCVGETFEVARCVMTVGPFDNLYQSMKGMNDCCVHQTV